jgi:quinol monooxygenase YgiN
MVPRYRGPGRRAASRIRTGCEPPRGLFVEHFASQAAYDAHTGSPAYAELIAGRFAGLVVAFTEIDHELLASI